MQLKDRYIFILGIARFDESYQSTSYEVARQLAKDNHVFYIDRPFTFNDKIRLKDKEEFKRRKPYFSLLSKGLMKEKVDNMQVIISPILLSINFLPEGRLYRAALWLNEWVLARRIAKVVKKQSITDFIYINSFNFHYPSIQRFLKPALCIYHSVDPMSNPFDAKHGVVSEEKIVRDSDLVICTSKQLYREKKAQNENTYFIPNSADIALSSMALDKNMQVHESIAHLKKPVIGYFGNVERRIDFELVKEMADRHTDKSFVFAGPVNREQVPEWLFTTPNIHLTGPIPYHLRPSVIKGFDVTMIPFKSDEFSRSVFPLKLFEYLGAGKPVISTRFNPDLEERTQQTVTFCDDTKAFSAAISEELQNNSEQRVQARLAVAGENTWEKSVSQISTLIATNIGLVSL